MKDKMLFSFAFLLVLAMFVSCSKDLADGDDALGGVTLRIKTRGQSGAASEMTVATPINLYVFDTAGQCVAYKSVASEKDVANFKLAAGAYRVYSVAGADAANYSLPTKEEATPQSVVALKEGMAHGDIMAANSVVVLTDGEETDVTLTMNRKVFMLRNVTISDVPENVAAITADVSPLYEGINVAGEYCGENGAYNVVLEKGTDGKWTKQCDAFLMESVGNPVVTFNFTTTDGKVKTFRYVSDKPLAANYKVDMTVNYQRVAEPLLKCLINGVSWAGEQTWTIDVKENEMGDNTGGDVKVDETAPEQGTVYKGCYVLKSEQSAVSGNITIVTLLAPKSKCSLIFNADDQADVKKAVDAGIAELAVEGVNGWRLPTKGEMEYIMDNRADINNNLKTLGLELIFSNTNGIYYFLNTDNKIMCMNEVKSSFPPSSGKAGRNLRPVATVTFLQK